MTKPAPSTPGWHKWWFRLPSLPTTEYNALKALCALLDASQWEVVCVGLRLVASVYKVDPAGLQALLGAFREGVAVGVGAIQAPLLTPDGSVIQSQAPTVE